MYILLSLTCFNVAFISLHCDQWIFMKLFQVKLDNLKLKQLFRMFGGIVSRFLDLHYTTSVSLPVLVERQVMTGYNNYFYQIVYLLYLVL